ncbi:solute carrier family 25 (mitochondrial aspartate/glutamate transporter) member 12/13 [Andalucia godoyi]|uniref:Solute carrier family 25 (Mitochondrial aspartate/glutamate transporter) member 12/13 n=1 Tax=Andalucia godoyi TaxID=505711 RepID=A0A8K0F471_ANDGO|nr:solute carrier family 25 (mitochondrial aspartate/glutamate transporter) member 12/13 [Andalucia godoyi]|eukprot:ANDGO_03970.mRNA.1 mitochondrial solute carrier family 25 (mitochondrial S-adenosylmethionine transporter) member 26
MTKSDVRLSLASSASAGLLVRFLTYPFDTIKARLQIDRPWIPQPASSKNVRTIAVNLRSLFRGLLVAIVGSVPAFTLYLSSYEMLKQSLEQSPFSHSVACSPFVLNMIAGLGAESISTLLWVPLDVVRQHQQIALPIAYPHTHSNLSHVLHSVYHGPHGTQPSVMNFYSGVDATLHSFDPYSAVYFGVYDLLKTNLLSWSMQRHNADGDRSTSFAEHMETAPVFFASGAIAACVTNPLDLVKLRLQMGVVKSVHQGFVTVIQDHGVKGLWKGCAARVAQASPSAAISIVFYEQFKLLYRCLFFFFECAPVSRDKSQNG